MNENGNQEQNQQEQDQKGGEKVNPVQLQKFLGGVSYPATKEDLIDQAEENGADENIMHTLESLPDDMEFASPADLNKHLK